MCTYAIDIKSRDTRSSTTATGGKDGIEIEGVHLEFGIVVPLPVDDQYTVVNPKY